MIDTPAKNIQTRGENGSGNYRDVNALTSRSVFMDSDLKKLAVLVLVVQGRGKIRHESEVVQI